MGDHQEDENWPEKVQDRLKTNYRLVVMNEDTFEEVNTYNFTPLKMGLLGGLGLITVAIGTGLLLFLTPIKHLLIKSPKDSVVLDKKITELEKELKTQQIWSENVRKVLVGEVDTLGTGHNEVIPDADSAVVLVARSELDERLRQNLEVEQQSNATAVSVNLPQSEVPLGQRFFTPPISGQISKPFNGPEKHYGVDIIAPKNTAIKATLDGFVISADWNLETGNTIAIQHKHDAITFYKHNSALLKKVGDMVKAGEAIAIIGDTGDHSSGPHLHFELWHKGIPVDPMDYVNFN